MEITLEAIMDLMQRLLEAHAALDQARSITEGK